MHSLQGALLERTGSRWRLWGACVHVWATWVWGDKPTPPISARITLLDALLPCFKHFPPLKPKYAHSLSNLSLLP